MWINRVNEFDRSSKPNHVDHHIGRRLREAREHLGEAPQHVAHALRMRVLDYLQIEAGTRRLGAEPMTRAAKLLRVNLAWFFEDLEASGKLEHGAQVTLKNVIDLNTARLRRRLP